MFLLHCPAFAPLDLPNRQLPDCKRRISLRKSFTRLEIAARSSVLSHTLLARRVTVTWRPDQLKEPPMPWTYSQSTGQLRHNGVLVSTGYSGAGISAATGRNNPSMQGVASVGPIPQGLYTIGPLHNSPNTGPNVMNLTPNGHNAQGRTDFQIHGNNATNNASHGCVVMPPAARQQVSSSLDHQLNVVP